MACRLFGAKALPEPLLPHCQLDFWEQISVTFESDSIIFIQENAFENVVCQNGGHFVQGMVSLHIKYRRGPNLATTLPVDVPTPNDAGPATRVMLNAKINTRQRQDDRHFKHDIFKWIFVSENCCRIKTY